MKRLFWFVVGIFVGATFRGELKITLKKVDGEIELDDVLKAYAKKDVEATQAMYEIHVHDPINSADISEIRNFKRRVREGNNLLAELQDYSGPYDPYGPRRV